MFIVCLKSNVSLLIEECINSLIVFICVGTDLVWFLAIQGYR